MAFDAFDHQKKGIVSTDMVGTMLGMLGHEIKSSILSEVINEFDPHGKFWFIISFPNIVILFQAVYILGRSKKRFICT